MTFRSLTIESHPSRESALAPCNASEDYKTLQSLNAYTFPASVHTFAKEHGLDVFYVDNAWIRVAMSGHMLKKFMWLGHGREVDLEEQIGRVRDEGWYVVTEEEF